MAGPDVGFVADLDEKVWIPVVGGKDPAASVVLHSPREDVHAGAGQGRGDGVPFEA